jgi:hypothetical protein
MVKRARMRPPTLLAPRDSTPCHLDAVWAKTATYAKTYEFKAFLKVLSHNKLAFLPNTGSGRMVSPSPDTTGHFKKGETDHAA